MTQHRSSRLWLDLPARAAPPDPSTGKARLYVRSDGVLCWRDSAGAESEAGGGGSGGAGSVYGFPTRLGTVVIPPTSWIWLNQGAAVATSEVYGERLAIPGSGSDSWRVRYITAPTPPYTVRACLFLDAVGENASLASLVWGDNGGQIEIYGLEALTGGMAMNGQRWGSVTGFTGQDYVCDWSDPLLWIELEDDNTDRKVRVSHTGETGSFIQVLTKGRTSFLTPTRLGWGGDDSTSKPATGYLLSWEVF